MSLKFKSRGTLRPGIHNCSIQDVLDQFSKPGYGSRLHRSNSLNLFHREIEPFILGLYINGSYITMKPAPNDVDVAIVLPSKPPIYIAAIKQLETIKLRYKDIHVFWYLEGSTGLRNMISYWRTDRDGYPKGIIFVEKSK